MFPCSFCWHRQALLYVFFWLVTELTVTPALMQLPLVITFGCHCLGFPSFCPTARQDASCKLENSAGLSHRHTHATEHYQMCTQPYTHKYGGACVWNWSATFVDTNGDNVALLKVRSGEIKTASLL